MKINENLAPLIEANLNLHLNTMRPTNELFFEIMSYSVLPAGKLFRPLLCASAYADICGINECIKQLENPHSDLSLSCSALEIHHAYTLIHDDLPCMDDDDMRRGRPSTHKKYGQWQAVLAGDALLHHSHSLMSKISDQKLRNSLKVFNWALGAKGLILGQVYDLSGAIHQSFENLLSTHLFKTARLIQTAIFLGRNCAYDNFSFTHIKETLRLGESLGISFQLLDDLSEATEELSSHELEVNPFINFPQEAFTRLYADLRQINKQTEVSGNTYLKEALGAYFLKMKGILDSDLQKEDSLILKYFGNFEEEDYDWGQIVCLLDANNLS